MKGKLQTVVIACILAVFMGTTDCKAVKTKNHRKIVSLAQIQGKSADGWDDSFVSEQIIDHDNTQAKQREMKEDEDKNSAENIEKSFAQTVLNQKIE